MYREQDPEIKMRYMYEKFADFFAADYKKLKEKTHELQAKCYERKDYNLKEAEECSRMILKPYLNQKKENEGLSKACEDEFARETARCKGNSKDQKSYYRCMNEPLGKLEACYEGKKDTMKENYKKAIKQLSELVDKL